MFINLRFELQRKVKLINIIQYIYREFALPPLYIDKPLLMAILVNEMCALFIVFKFNISKYSI